MENAYLYFTVLIAAVSLSSLALYDQTSARDYRFALGVILTAALVTPAVSSIKSLSSLEFDYTGGDFESVSLSKTLEDAFADGIRDGIAEEFSIGKKSIEVEIFGFDADKMTADGIRVTLVGTAALTDIVAVEKFVSELGIGECSTEVRLG